MSSNKTFKPNIIYNKPPNVKLSSPSELASCTIANMSIPPPGMIPEQHSEQDKQTEKLGYWGYRHLYPFGGYGYGRWGYPYWRRGCYGFPCNRGGMWGHPWY
jgi:hypothetical protein